MHELIAYKITNFRLDANGPNTLNSGVYLCWTRDKEYGFKTYIKTHFEKETTAALKKTVNCGSA